MVCPSGDYTVDVVGEIAEKAFYECSSLTSVTIGPRVTSIGRYAFESCSSLSSVVIGNSVTSIGYYAFAHCSSLTSMSIGSSVAAIDSRSFFESRLGDVLFLGVCPPGTVGLAEPLISGCYMGYCQPHRVQVRVISDYASNDF